MFTSVLQVCVPVACPMREREPRTLMSAESGFHVHALAFNFMFS